MQFPQIRDGESLRENERSLGSKRNERGVVSRVEILDQFGLEFAISDVVCGFMVCIDFGRIQIRVVEVVWNENRHNSL